MTYERPSLPAAIPVPGANAPRFQPFVIRLKGVADVPAAAFRRGQHIWLLFDLPVRANIAKQIARVAPELAPVRQFRQGEALVLRLTAPLGLAPKIRRDGDDWLVDLRPRLTRPEHPAMLDPNTGKGGSRILVSVQGAGRLLTLNDPALGDVIHVLPVKQVGFGLAATREFPQFAALATHQGLAVVPRSDNLWVTLDQRGLQVTGSGGLLVTPGMPGTVRASETAEPASGRRLFDLAVWRQGGAGNFEVHRKRLQSALVAPPTRQHLDLARLELARFFFAHGRSPESLSILQLMTRDATPSTRDPEVILLEAASHFLVHDYLEAAAALSHPALDGEMDALLWRAASLAVSQDWAYAAELFEQAGDLFADYVRPVRNRLRLLAAEARLGIGDTGGASLYLAQVLEDQPNESERAQLDFLEGRRMLADERPKRAAEIWQRLADTAHRPTQARARLALVNLGLTQGTTDRAAAIAELERLRFVWRGDEFEAALLERLAELYGEAADYRRALNALRQVASHFPGSARATLAARRMRTLFVDLYLGERAAGLPPLTGLALYEEFEELTPVGQAGNELIENLVDRLVRVDLLDRAAELLEDQIAHRLAGANRARAGARLALIRLLDHQPDGALAALRSSFEKALPKEIARQRRHLKARALAELGRGREGLSTLSGDESADGLRLRAEILWELRDWAAAAVALDRLVPKRPPKDRPLEDAESQAVINLAIAHTLAGNRRALDDLARRYGRAMTSGAKKDSFALLTSDFAKADISAVAQELAGVERIQAFMTSYRARVRQGGLSSLN